MEITTRELLENHLDKTSSVIVDVRPVEAYNGWKLKSEWRGGHISGARSLPAKWSEYIDWIEIVRSKGFNTDQDIILYGYDGSDAQRVAEQFLKAGYKNTSIYNGFIDEWSPGEDLPMDHLHGFRQLVYPQWLQQLLSGEKPPEYGGNKFVLCHAHYRNKGDYDEGHIPGSIELDTLTLESPETWNRRSPGELLETLKSKGITHDTTVILYGRFSYPDNDDPFPGSSAGHLGAIRCAFIMMYAGVKDVRILNGGITSWENAGFKITTEGTEPKPVQYFGISIPARPELAVDMDEAKNMLVSPDSELVCVRSYPEYFGEVSGYNYIQKTGRIPGTVFGDCGSDAYHMENYRNLDHTTREFREIARNWEKSGLSPDKHLAFYCGTGWRGSEAFLNAYLMGWPRISVFDGGWFEWSNDPDNPIETGLPV